MWDEQITEDVLRNIIEYAGQYKGIGDWRPGGKPGPYGIYSADWLVPAGAGGMAGQLGKTGHGRARQGKGYNVAGSVFPEGAIRCGEARQGPRRGRAWQGKGMGPMANSFNGIAK